MAVLGSTPPANVVINEMTTVASVWTNAQFLDGTAIKGPPLSLRIAAGNVPNFVDLQTGGWGAAIQDPLNSGQTPTMANFATLADLLAGCATRVTLNACDKLFTASTPPKGGAPTDTLTAAQSIARAPWYQPERLFALLDQFYPVPKARTCEPFRTCRTSTGPQRLGAAAQVRRRRVSCGRQGDVRQRGQPLGRRQLHGRLAGARSLWQGNATKFAPNGRPLSPITTGFAGGGMEGGTFGAAVDAKDNAWLTSYGGKSITVFDKNGKPLTPPEGITFDGKLGLMQGVIVTPSSDVWVLGVKKSQLVYFPKGDLTKGRIVCEGDSAEPCKSFRAPFHLGIDQQDRIWVSNAASITSRAFPPLIRARPRNSRPGTTIAVLPLTARATSGSPTGSAAGLLGMAHLIDMGVRLKLEGVAAASDYLTKTMSKQQGGPNGGSVTLLRPDGTQFPGSPFKSRGLPGPWAAVVDGNDNVWISNFNSSSSPIVQLCGVRTENCPPGMKTGDQISPPGGYVGGGLQMQTDIAIDPAGNVWVMNNWQDIDSCIGTPRKRSRRAVAARES